MHGKQGTEESHEAVHDQVWETRQALPDLIVHLLHMDIATSGVRFA
jgi:hypothetical protein